MPDSHPPDALAIIPLREGSKGLRGKNCRPLAGKPLFLHSVEQALRTVGRCVITTDISDVLTGSFPVGCQVISRPTALAGDHTPMAPVLMHLFERFREERTLPRIAVLLQATSPTRRDEDVRRALAVYQEGQFELVMSVVRTDPGVLKYGFARGNRFTPVSRPDFCFSNRQSLPEIVRPNGAVYVFSPETFLQNGGWPTRSIGSIEMPGTYSIDIDTEADFKHAQDQLSQQVFSKAG